MWGFPRLTILVIAAMVGIVVGMLFDATVRMQVLLSLGVAVVIGVAAYLYQRRVGTDRAEVADSEMQSTTTQTTVKIASARPTFGG